MTDIQDKYRERWRDRRSKNYNWRKVIIMTLALVALILLMTELGKVRSKPGSTAISTSDSVSAPTDTPRPDSIPVGDQQ